LQLLGIHRLTESLPGFQEVVTLIDGDPEKPGAELGLLPERPDMDKGLEKSLLSQILGFLLVHHQAAGQSVNLPLIFVHQFLEGREVTLLRPGHEVRVAHVVSSPGFIKLDLTDL
jgi:hypothetical protein